MTHVLKIMFLCMFSVMFAPMVYTLIIDSPDNSLFYTSFIGGLVCLALVFIFGYIEDELNSID